MARRVARKAGYTGGPTTFQLGFILRTLNENPDGEFRGLVNLWLKCGRNFQNLCDQNETLGKKLRGEGKAMLVADGEGARIVPIPAGALDATSQGSALAMFSTLLTHPDVRSFAGACPQCDKFFIKKSMRQKVYCSAGCGRKTTATEVTQVKRKREHEAKLVTARRVIANSSPTRTRWDWRGKVRIEAGVTDHWITRALNKGELTAPVARLK